MIRLFFSGIVLLLFTLSSQASDDSDFLTSFVPSLVASLNCDAGEFEACPYPGGCRRINGLWEDGMCVAKSQERLNTELMAGKWFLVSSFANGDFFNYLQFDKYSTKLIPGSIDYFMNGKSHSTADFADLTPTDAVVSYDSSNADWFILDYWGLDINTISSIEINRVTNNLFTGCEFYLNYPDLTYKDGICNPVRMTRNRLFKTDGLESQRAMSRPSAILNTSSKVVPMKVAGSKVRINAKKIHSISVANGVEYD